jgi:hypothetical protein
MQVLATHWCRMRRHSGDIRTQRAQECMTRWCCSIDTQSREQPNDEIVA